MINGSAISHRKILLLLKLVPTLNGNIRIFFFWFCLVTFIIWKNLIKLLFIIFRQINVKIPSGLWANVMTYSCTKKVNQEIETPLIFPQETDPFKSEP